MISDCADNWRESSSGHINVDLGTDTEDGELEVDSDDILHTSTEDHNKNPGDAPAVLPPCIPEQGRSFHADNVPGNSAQNLESTGNTYPQQSLENTSDSEINDSTDEAVINASSGQANLHLETDSEDAESTDGDNTISAFTEDSIEEDHERNMTDTNPDSYPDVLDLEKSSHPDLIGNEGEYHNRGASSDHISVNMETHDKDGESTSSGDTEDTIIKCGVSTSTSGEAEAASPPNTPGQEDTRAPGISSDDAQTNNGTLPGLININLQHESQDEARSAPQTKSSFTDKEIHDGKKAD